MCLYLILIRVEHWKRGVAILTQEVYKMEQKMIEKFRQIHDPETSIKYIKFSQQV
jgi:hypothetical protein